MKKKLNQYLIAVSVLAIVLTVLFTSLVFWRQIEHEAMSQVKSTVSLLANYVDLESGDEAAMEAIDESITTWNQGENPVRITHIASDGTVLFDNEADAGEMENHLSRPEVQEALADGTGESTRSSVTMGGQISPRRVHDIWCPHGIPAGSAVHLSDRRGNRGTCDSGILVSHTPLCTADPRDGRASARHERAGFL